MDGLRRDNLACAWLNVFGFAPAKISLAGATDKCGFLSFFF